MSDDSISIPSTCPSLSVNSYHSDQEVEGEEGGGEEEEATEKDSILPQPHTFKERQQGSISFRTYYHYFHAGGSIAFIALVFGIVVLVEV